MGGGLVDVESRTTVVLIGKTGNGKSATANSIIGRRSFTFRASSSGVTTCCELQTTVLQNGRTVNVINTLFDFSGDTQQMAKEITNCLQLVEDGVHALILVLSVRTRFSKEEEGAVKCLKEIFGEKILDYMIVLFTGGDQLEDDEMELQDYLSQCPQPLKELLSLCEERIVLFNNKTKNEKEKAQQVNELFMFVDLITGLFVEVKF
ncbi:P-loop containing nucleoside triphosphate hydrolase protein [Dioscorea alata]|uniref:P-loop containing nucleoside triphosphate hydrolase protein n=1 Tax=Dioscorea alata TaxID=55571 RepID=A0ACB7W251_DIOAL|nr:P-loop containing nucleoside triphosphate hydrolase protein [Dioscorea alata]